MQSISSLTQIVTNIYNIVSGSLWWWWWSSSSSSSSSLLLLLVLATHLDYPCFVFAVIRPCRPIFFLRHTHRWSGQHSQYSDWLRAGRSGDQIPVGARFSAPVLPCSPPSLLYNGYRAFPGGKERPGRDADPSPPSSAVVRAIPLFPLWALRPEQTLSACTRVHFTTPARLCF